MQVFIARRLAETVLVVFLALTAVFVMLHMTGDPALLMVPMDATPEFVEQFREQMGFNDPLIVQYGRFIADAVHGDFGDSLRQRVPAMALTLERIGPSLMLTSVAITAAVAVAIPTGIITAVRRNSFFDRLGIIAAVLGQSVPTFWLGLMLILLFSVKYRWFPTGGFGGIKHFVLPALSLAAYSTARLTRLTRSAVLDVLGHDYVLTARAKGLSQRVVVWKHALRNALIPVVTMTALQVGVLFGGAVVTETIFSWPGVGRLVYQSIQFRDIPVVLAAVFVISLMFTLLNLVVDILYAVINPSIRFT